MIDISQQKFSALILSLTQSNYRVYLADFSRQTLLGCLELLKSLLGILISLMRELPILSEQSPLKSIHEYLTPLHKWVDSDIRHAGLKNQGCICDLNSLIQQLFMNETFRKIVRFSKNFFSTLGTLLQERPLQSLSPLCMQPRQIWQMIVVCFHSKPTRPQKSFNSSLSRLITRKLCMHLS